MTEFLPISSRRGTQCSAGIVVFTGLALLLAASAPSALAQSFNFWQSPTAVARSDAEWGDFDNDGDLDLVICGQSSGPIVTKTYENQNGTLVPHQDLIGVRSNGSGNLAWGDYDGDGDLDLAVAGTGDGGAKIARIYQNDGAGNLTWDTQQVLTGVSYGAAVAWGDYDNDGDLDLVVTGAVASGPGSSILYRNDPHGMLTPDSAVCLTGLYAGSADWADYDGDGDLDLLLAGSDGTQSRIVFYENHPVGTLTDDGDHDLPGLVLSDAAWGDFDCDGDLDLAITGELHYGGPRCARVYENDGSGGLTLMFQPLYMYIYRSSCAWGDYDNDGDLDVAFAGYTGGVDYTRIYSYTGSNFAHTFSLQSADEGSVTWADVDNDGNLDFFLTGRYGANNRYALLYRNGPVPPPTPPNPPNPNSPPSAPTQLSGAATVCGLHLSWSGASDAETPATGLYYCLRVGTSQGAHDVVSGTYATPLMGNVGQATNLVLAVPAGTYYWSVRTIDSGFMASPWSNEQQANKQVVDCNNNGVDDLQDIAEGTSDDCNANCVPDDCDIADGTSEDCNENSVPDECDLDTDADGLIDDCEDAIGTDPSNPDTDGDGLLDGTEVDMAEGGQCPDPLDDDSDDDSLLDGHEVDVMGTNPCSSDTDGDGVPDNVDPEPTVPGETSGVLEDACRQQAENIQGLDLSVFNGPNDNANSGRSNALANRATEAANAIAQGDIEGAIESLTSLLEKIDGETPPPDWMDDSDERTALAAEVSLLIALLECEL